MFSLDGTYRYWLYNKPVDMRKSFNGLSGIVTNAMCERLRSGDVFIFVNSSRNMMKMLRQEEGGLVSMRSAWTWAGCGCPPSAERRSSRQVWPMKT